MRYRPTYDLPVCFSTRLLVFNVNTTVDRTGWFHRSATSRALCRWRRTSHAAASSATAATSIVPCPVSRAAVLPKTGWLLSLERPSRLVPLAARAAGCDRRAGGVRYHMSVSRSRQEMSLVCLVLGDGGLALSFGPGDFGALGHGDDEHRQVPKRIEALRGRGVAQVSSSCPAA